MSEELKPCPFCGSSAAYFIDGNNGDTFAGCEVCNCSSDHFADDESAAAVWNTRPIEDALRAQLAEAQAENDGFRSMMKSEVFDGLSTEQLIFIIHSMQDERAAKCLEYETTIEEIKNDAEFWFQQNTQTKIDYDKWLSEEKRCNRNQALIISALWEKHPEDAPSDEDDSGSYDSLVPDEYKSKDESWIDQAALTIKYIKENRAREDRKNT